MFIGFAVTPEWDVSMPLSPGAIDVKEVTSRQFDQNPAFRRVVQRLRAVVQEELAMPHILGFHDRLHEVTPGPGYAFDRDTRRIVSNPIRLATPTSSTTSTAIAQLPGASASSMPW